MIQKMGCYFFATFDGNDAILVVATVFRAARPLAVVVVVVPFEITAGLDVRRKIEVERLIVVGFFSVEFFAVVQVVRLLPDIA